MKRFLCLCALFCLSLVACQQGEEGEVTRTGEGIVEEQPAQPPEEGTTVQDQQVEPVEEPFEIQREPGAEPELFPQEQQTRE